MRVRRRDLFAAGRSPSLGGGGGESSGHRRVAAGAVAGGWRWGGTGERWTGATRACEAGPVRPLIAWGETAGLPN